jgi:hypothetical protein
MPFISNRQDIGITNLSIAPVPLPAGLPLLLSGLGGICQFGRRSKKAVAAGTG